MARSVWPGPVAQDLIGLYRLDDPDLARTRAAAHSPTCATARSASSPGSAAARVARRTRRALRPPRRVERADREPQSEDQKHQAGHPRLSQTSTTTGCDCCSNTAESAEVTHRHGSELALPSQVQCVEPDKPSNASAPS